MSHSFATFPLRTGPHRCDVLPRRRVVTVIVSKTSVFTEPDDDHNNDTLEHRP